MYASSKDVSILNNESRLLDNLMKVKRVLQIR